MIRRIHGSFFLKRKSTFNSKNFFFFFLYCTESAVFYSLNQANLLTEKLSKKHLPGLSSQEQMYLLALSDTIASSKDVDIEGIESEDRKYRTEVTSKYTHFLYKNKLYKNIRL